MLRDRLILRRRQGGFVLVEALMAIGMLGVTLVLVHGAFAAGRRAHYLAESEAVALGIAKTRLREAGVSTPLSEGALEGSEQGYDWRVAMARHIAPGETAVRPRLPAWWVTVDVRWMDTGAAREYRVNLRTLKLGASP